MIRLLSYLLNGVFALLVYLTWPTDIQTRLNETVYITGTLSGIPYNGTGVIVGDNVVLTAGHVVERGENITVKTRDGRTYFADTYYTKDKEDLGILITTEPMQGDHARVSCTGPVVGDTLHTSGHPDQERWGYYPITVVGGGQDKNFPEGMKHNNAIQVAGVLFQGLSGGPVWNYQGQVVAIVSTDTFFNVDRQLVPSGLGGIVSTETACEMVRHLTTAGADATSRAAEDNGK